MKRTYVWREGQFVEKVRDVSPQVYVQDDIKEHRSNDGTMITGRRQFREHLKRTGTVEMGISDMNSAREKWQSRQAAFQEKVQSASKHQVAPVDAPSTEIHEEQRSRISAEMANRLDGRPLPDRKTMIKLTLETARDIARRR